MADYDLAVIGGGLNGVSIARDAAGRGVDRAGVRRRSQRADFRSSGIRRGIRPAAGRGLRVILLEQGDLGAGASQASPRLIHGDLAVLERRAFFRVRAALKERDIGLRTAPHLVRPMRFVIPAHSDERQPWVLRSWLLLYDRLASRSRLPASATIDITRRDICR